MAQLWGQGSLARFSQVGTDPDQCPSIHLKNDKAIWHALLWVNKLLGMYAGINIIIILLFKLRGNILISRRFLCLQYLNEIMEEIWIFID